MSNLLEKQTSGNEWPTPEQGGILQPLQTPQQPPSLALRQQQRSIFDNLEAQMVRFAQEHQESLKVVKGFYIFPKDSPVLQFMNSHRGIPQLLADAVPHLRKHFPQTVFTLRSTLDDSGSPMLYAVALWPGEPHDAVVALDQFDDEWWLANAYPAGRFLTFTYDLI